MEAMMKSEGGGKMEAVRRPPRRQRPGSPGHYNRFSLLLILGTIYPLRSTTPSTLFSILKKKINLLCSCLFMLLSPSFCRVTRPNSF